MLRSEVFPAPFGPMTEINSPERTESVTVSTARTPPKCFETPVTTSCASPGETLPPFTSPDTMPPAFPRLPLARICAPLMAGMMQTQAAEGNGLCDCRALLLTVALSLRRRRETIGAEISRRRVVKRGPTGNSAYDRADRLSRQRQNDAAAPRACLARACGYRRHHQRDRRDRDRPSPGRLCRRERPRAARGLPVLRGARGPRAHIAQPPRPSRCR